MFDRLVSYRVSLKFGQEGDALKFEVLPDPNQSKYLTLSSKQKRAKRRMDLIFCVFLIVITLPLCILIAVAIKATSPGPILFKQPRIGHLDQLFLCYKFRSMYSHSEDLLCDTQTIVGDVRVTPVGRWLRRLSLDELPQFLNVIRGEMSLVGPRPHAPATKAGSIPFDRALKEYSSRHGVLPGITGLAQINGCRGPTKTVQQLKNRVDFDLKYILEWSLWLDLKIIVLTVIKTPFAKEAL